MLTGYILFRVKKAPNISRSINLLLWFVSIGIMFLLVFGVWDGELNILMTSFYVSLGHSGEHICYRFIDFPIPFSFGIFFMFAKQPGDSHWFGCAYHATGESLDQLIAYYPTKDITRWVVWYTAPIWFIQRLCYPRRYNWKRQFSCRDQSTWVFKSNYISLYKYFYFALQFTMSFGNTGIAFVFAFFISILFERPAIRLLKILL